MNFSATAAQRPLEERASHVFSGRLVSIGASPTFISGAMPAWQTLRFEVLAVEKGTLKPGESAEISVLVVAGGKNVLSDKGGIPALDPAYFQVNRHYRVLAIQGATGLSALPHGDAVLLDE